MKIGLREYLKGITNCPEMGFERDDDLVYVNRGEKEPLWKEWGIYDNYDIRLGLDLETTLEYFIRSNSFRSFKKGGQEEDYRYFHYNPGTVNIRVNSEYHPYDLYFMESMKRGGAIVDEKDFEDFETPTRICFYPYQGLGGFSGKKMKGVVPERAMALAIGEVCEWVLDKKIPLFIPEAKCDFSRFVLHRPNLEVEGESKEKIGV